MNGENVGVMLTSTWSGMDFGPFAEVVPAQVFPGCKTGEDLASSPVLSEVEVAPVTGEVWVGGACGRVWTYSPSSQVLTEVKSGTDAHVVGMSFVPDGSSARGFIGAFRNSETQQCITSVQ